MSDIGVSNESLEKLMIPHEKPVYGHSGFGGGIFNPTPSLVDKDIEQYSNEINRYQITDTYLDDHWVTVKINTFYEKYKGKIVYYILYTESIKIVRKVRIINKISDDRGRHFIEYEPI